MAAKNGKVPGTYVSEKDLNDLANLLGVFKDHILSHEARLEVLEAWVVQFMEANAPVSEAGAEGTSEAEGTSAPLILSADGTPLAEVASSEPSNDSEEG